MPKRKSTKARRVSRPRRPRVQPSATQPAHVPTLKRIYPPLPGDLQRFIAAYVTTRDLGKAAESVGMPRSRGLELWKTRGRFKRELMHRVQIADLEQARYAAIASALTIELIDAELVAALKMPALPGMAAAKVAAVKLAYGRRGIVVDPESKPPAPPRAANPMYEWLFQQKQQEESTNTGPQTVEGKLLPAASVTVPFERPRTRNEEIRIEIDGELVD